MASNQDKLLQLIYRLSNGQPDQVIGRKKLGRPLGLSDKETKQALKTLSKAGYIRAILFNSLALTAAGVAHVELNLQADPGEVAPASSPDDVRQLIRRKQRRLQKLQESQALKGANTPPETLLEIEDLQADLESLHGQLDGLKESNS